MFGWVLNGLLEVELKAEENRGKLNRMTETRLVGRLDLVTLPRYEAPDKRRVEISIKSSD